MVAKHPDLLVRVRPNGLEDTPQFAGCRSRKAQVLGVSLSGYQRNHLRGVKRLLRLNDFTDRGRVKKHTFSRRSVPYAVDINNLMFAAR